MNISYKARLAQTLWFISAFILVLTIPMAVGEHNMRPFYLALLGTLPTTLFFDHAERQLHRSLQLLPMR